MPIDNKKSDELNNNTQKEIPQAVISRLPRYYRTLRTLAANDVLRVSSKSLAEMLDITPSQLRTDLSMFGGFGQQGYGYNVKQLFNSIGSILGIGDEFTAVVVGHGPLADAVAQLPLFTRHGIRLLARLHTDDGFDAYLNELGESKTPDIAVLVLDDPSDAAASAAKADMKGIMNFSECELDPKRFPSLLVVNTDISDSLTALCCMLKRKS